jgi:hypothetical protein
MTPSAQVARFGLQQILVPYVLNGPIWELEVEESETIGIAGAVQVELVVVHSISPKQTLSE